MAQRMTFGLFSGAASQRIEFVRMKGPRGMKILVLFFNSYYFFIIYIISTSNQLLFLNNLFNLLVINYYFT